MTNQMQRLTPEQTLSSMTDTRSTWFCGCCSRVVKDTDDYGWHICDESGVPYRVHSGECTDIHNNGGGVSEDTTISSQTMTNELNKRYLRTVLWDQMQHVTTEQEAYQLIQDFEEVGSEQTPEEQRLYAQIASSAVAWVRSPRFDTFLNETVGA